MVRRLIAVAILTTLVAVPATAQKLSETVDVALVEVPVKVYDRDGNPVRDLTKANFRVFDRGREVDLSFFETIDILDLPSEPSPATPLPPIVTRNFLILFDLTNSEFGNIERAKSAAKEFVEAQLEENDVAAVGTFSVENGFRLVINFTRDQQLLRDAVDTLGNPNLFQVIDPLFITATVNTMAAPASSNQTRADVGDEIAAQAVDFNRVNQQQHREFMKKRLRAQLDNFAAVARLLDRIPGQKQIILLSEGFDASMVHGREDFGADAADEAAASLRGEVWKIDSDARFGSAQSQKEIEEMAKVFRRSDVVLHAIDIKGLRTDVSAEGGVRRSSNDSLFLLTNPTGGTVFKNANDLSTGFEKMMTQQEVVYLLGFLAEASGEPGAFHELTVKLRDAPRGSRVSHRAGYHEPAPASTLERAMTTTEILLSDIPYDQIPFGILTATFPVGDAAQVPVVIEIDGPKLMEGVAGNIVNGEIFVYAFDEQQKVQDFIYHRLTLDLDQVSATLSRSGIRYYGTLSLKPGRYAIRTLIRVQESDYIGFRRIGLDVPSFDSAVVLPPFALADQGDWIMLRGRSARSAEFEYPFVMGDESFIPGVRPQMSPESSYRIALVTYHCAPEQLQVSATVRDPSGGSAEPAALTMVGRTPLGDDGRMGMLFDFSTAGLARGESYVLNFDVTPDDGATHSSEMAFTIR